MVNFNIFGSESSLDYDVAVVVSEIPPTQAAHDLCKYYNHTLENMMAFAQLEYKPVNTNLIVVLDGEVIDCFKGTYDELNNSLLTTYDNHQQFNPQIITKKLLRDKEWKLLRTARVILSFFSRTENRVEIKSALRGNLFEKYDILKQLNVIELTESITQKVSEKDFYKIVAFQVGQCLGLHRGIELYTKEAIWEEYPLLKPFLTRTANYSQMQHLQDYYQLFLSLVDSCLFELGQLNEESYIKTKNS
jgi:hypothetical protein